MRCLSCLLLLLAASLLRAGDNLVRNPDFAAGLEHWTATFPEPNETNYSRNHLWVKVVQVDGKPALEYTLSAPVAASEGVKTVSDLIEVDPARSYEFGAEVWSAAPSLILFLEGYREDPERTEKGNDQYPGYVRTYRATIFVKGEKNAWQTVRRRISPMLKRRDKAPTHVLIKLYAYHPPGVARFRNVFLRAVDTPD